MGDLMSMENAENFILALKEREMVVEKALKKASHVSLKFPKGHLRVSIHKGNPRYYHVTKTGDNNGKYIKKQNFKLVIDLANKDYNRAFLKTAEEELDLIENAINTLSTNNSNQVYDNLSDTRKKLVKPYIEPDESVVEEWKNIKYNPKNNYADKKVYPTHKGDLVRSKSEMIIADMLYDLGIPYHYEKPVFLGEDGIRYPDFTIFNVKTKEEIYLEHLGMLDNVTYLFNALSKLDTYRANGIYIGKNLLLTYEIPEIPLDVEGVKKMFTELFL
ncbi:MAG: hypothetical protein K6D02_02880 [Lachnospiraceae bacterium]|nr:hypothetical protein [Lachnospiraceae bacterium]